MNSIQFWQSLDDLIATSRLIIDRPKGTPHPRFPSLIYPLDYGYLEGTSSADGGGIDVWVGGLPEKTLTAVVLAIDLNKRDTEIKLLLGCTSEDIRLVMEVHNGDSMSAMLVERTQS